MESRRCFYTKQIRLSSAVHCSTAPCTTRSAVRECTDLRQEKNWNIDTLHYITRLGSVAALANIKATLIIRPGLHQKHSANTYNANSKWRSEAVRWF